MEIKNLDIETLLTFPESRTLEFKANLSSLKPILKTLIAFANTAGGILIIGIGDDKKLLGVEDILASEEKLANSISDSISPALMPEIEITSVQGLSLLVVRVPHWRGPFYLNSEGNEKGIYVRLGSTNRAATGELLEELKRSIMKVSFDQLPCPEVDASGLDYQRISKAFSKVGKNNVDSSVLERLHILVPYNNRLVCSNGGLILFGQDKYRKQYFPNTEIRCARFQGEKKVDFIDQYDFQGTILEAIGNISKFIQRNTRLAASIENIKRENIPEYAPVIIREILANALVHADYSILGMNTKIAIFSDRLEIESPGMLPFGFTLGDFFSGVSHVRNKVIARVFRELNIIEEWGTGYRRIRKVCSEDNYPTPSWNEMGASVRVSLKPHIGTQDKTPGSQTSVETELPPRQMAIKKFLQKESALSAKEINEQFSYPIPERTLRNDLLEMKKKGVIKTIGRGPATQWKLIID